MKGTWQTTDSGGGGAGVVLVAGLMLLAASGAATAIAVTVVVILISVVVLTVLTVAGLAAFLVYRARRGAGEPPEGGFAPRPVVYRLPGPERPAAAVPAPKRPAIEAPARELHLHFHGVDAEQVAEILRQQERN